MSVSVCQCQCVSADRHLFALFVCQISFVSLCFFCINKKKLTNKVSVSVPVPVYQCVSASVSVVV